MTDNPHDPIPGGENQLSESEKESLREAHQHTLRAFRAILRGGLVESSALSQALQPISAPNAAELGPDPLGGGG